MPIFDSEMAHLTSNRMQKVPLVILSLLLPVFGSGCMQVIAFIKDMKVSDEQKTQAVVSEEVSYLGSSAPLKMLVTNEIGAKRQVQFNALAFPELSEGTIEEGDLQGIISRCEQAMRDYLGKPKKVELILYKKVNHRYFEEYAVDAKVPEAKLTLAELLLSMGYCQMNPAYRDIVELKYMRRAEMGAQRANKGLWSFIRVWHD